MGPAPVSEKSEIEESSERGRREKKKLKKAVFVYLYFLEANQIGLPWIVSGMTAY